MVLRGRHGAGVEPGVDDRRQTAGAGAAPIGGTGDLNLVDVGTVEIELAEVTSGELAQLGDRAHASVVAVRAPPDRQGRTPVAVA